MTGSALIITGGDVDYHYRQAEDCHMIIAVDGGLKAAHKMGLRPDIIIGDFDTVSPALLNTYETQSDVKVIRLLPEKDDTDTEAAVRYAIKNGIKKIDILGATGSRFDHTYANMFLLKMALEQNVMIYLYTGLSKIYLIHGKREYCRKDFFGKYISFLQFDGSASGVTIKGFKYDVSEFDFDTRKTYRLGVSNEPLSDRAYIEIKEGYMLAIESLEDNATNAKH